MEDFSLQTDETMDKNIVRINSDPGPTKVELKIGKDLVLTATSLPKIDLPSSVDKESKAELVQLKDNENLNTSKSISCHTEEQLPSDKSSPPVKEPSTIKNNLPEPVEEDKNRILHQGEDKNDAPMSRLVELESENALLKQELLELKQNVISANDRELLDTITQLAERVEELSDQNKLLSSKVENSNPQVDGSVQKNPSQETSSKRSGSIKAMVMPSKSNISLSERQIVHLQQQNKELSQESQEKSERIIQLLLENKQLKDKLSAMDSTSKTHSHNQTSVTNDVSSGNRSSSAVVANTQQMQILVDLSTLEQENNLLKKKNGVIMEEIEHLNSIMDQARNTTFVFTGVVMKAFTVGKPVLYTVRVTTLFGFYEISRRYSDFEDLRNETKISLAKEKDFPQFPEKLISGNQRLDLLQKRMVGLQKFMDYLFKKKSSYPTVETSLFTFLRR